MFDGFYAAVVARDNDLVIGADLLGLFPIYYANVGDVLLAGSSAEPFCAHPLFGRELDTAALIGYLLTGGPFDGTTLVKGVRRLGAGAMLRWRQGGHPVEQPHYELPSAGLEEAMPFVEQVERYDEVMTSTLRRHVAAHNDIDVLLSGGRDSRVLAGYLAELRTPRDTLTLGLPRDNDASCAARVARALRWPHRVHEIQSARFPEYADRCVQAEQLAGGMSTVHTWGVVDLLEETGGALLSGYLLEIRQTGPLPGSRAGMLAWTYAHALSPERLLSLLRSEELRALLRDVVQSVEARYDASVEDESERSWRWLASVYARFHPGSVPWRLSFARWPILPIVDRTVIEMMLSLPTASLDSRRLQDALLARRFPHLARLPLDRNSESMRPIVPSLGWRLRAATRAVLGGVRESARPTERRYFARMYDFDNPGWRAIRQAAEPSRHLLDEWFERPALDALVPGPETTAAHHDVIREGFGPKMLTGFMRWCAMHQGR